MRDPSADCNAYNASFTLSRTSFMRSSTAAMYPRVRVLVAALAATALAGCGGNYAAHSAGAVGGGSSGSVVSDGGLHASVTIPISATAANVIAAVGILGLLAVGNNVSPVRPALMQEDRTINEQDCTQPIANGLANLKCR